MAFRFQQLYLPLTFFQVCIPEHNRDRQAQATQKQFLMKTSFLVRLPRQNIQQILQVQHTSKTHHTKAALKIIV